MTMPDGRIVAVTDGTSKLSKADRDAGRVWYKVIPRTGFDAPVEGKILKSELVDGVISAVPVERGYIPITYRDAKYHVTVINPGGGTSQRVFASPNRHAAETFARQMNARFDGESGNRLFAYADRWDVLWNKSTVLFPKRGIKLMEVYDDIEMEGIRRSLEKIKGDLTLDPDISPAVAKIRAEKIQVFLENMDYATLKRRNVGARAHNRLAGAKSEKEALEVANQFNITPTGVKPQKGFTVLLFCGIKVLYYSLNEE